jgi:hypothetical protein
MRVREGGDVDIFRLMVVVTGGRTREFGLIDLIHGEVQDTVRARWM